MLVVLTRQRSPIAPSLLVAVTDANIVLLLFHVRLISALRHFWPLSSLSVSLLGECTVVGTLVFTVAILVLLLKHLRSLGTLGDFSSLSHLIGGLSSVCTVVGSLVFTVAVLVLLLKHL